MTAVRELFHICFWLARTYGKGTKPADGLVFNPMLLPTTSPVPQQTLVQLQQLESQLAEKDTKLTELLSGKMALDAELERLLNGGDFSSQARTRLHRTPTTIQRRRPESTSSTCCSRKPDGLWTDNRTGNIRSLACLMKRAKASWITFSGVTTASRLD